MNTTEKKVVTSYLDELVNCTICNVTLLKHLEKENVLSHEDVQTVEAEATNIKKADTFYKIIVTKAFFLPKLKRALEATNQSLALLVLNGTRNEFDRNKLLGQGSYGCVYKGEHFGVDVAIKRLQIDASESAEREINILKKFSKHDNIVSFMGFGTTGTHLLIYMELCDMNLKNWVVNKQPIKISPLEVLRQITVGLEWLHENKIVHMDLKPENILLTSLPERVKITDFGFSRQIVDGRSGVSTYEAGGTLGWLAPEVLEQAKEEAAGSYKYIYKTSSDIFSLGCIYYYVLTDGKHAYGQGHSGIIHANIIHNKTSIYEDQLVHGCKQNVFFIILMVSPNVSARPTCTTLLSSPLFWSKDRSCRFMYDLLTYGEEIWRPVLLFNEKTKCNLEHKDETYSLLNRDIKIDNADGCVIIMAYLKCQNINGVLEQYYTATNGFDLHELNSSRVLTSNAGILERVTGVKKGKSIGDSQKAIVAITSTGKIEQLARNTEEEKLFQLANQTFSRLEAQVIERFNCWFKQPSHCLDNSFVQDAYRGSLDTVIAEIPNAKKLQVCKLVEVKSLTFKKELEKLPNIHSRVNKLMRSNVCFPEDKISSELFKQFNTGNKITIYGQNVLNAFANVYTLQNKLIGECEKRLELYFYEEVVTHFDSFMETILNSRDTCSCESLRQLYLALTDKYMAKVCEIRQHKARESSSLSIIYWVEEPELKSRLKSSYNKYRFLNTANLEKRHIEVNSLIFKYKQAYKIEMDKCVRQSQIQIPSVILDNISIINQKNVIEPFNHELRSIIGENELIDGHLKTFRAHLEKLRVEYLDLNSRVVNTKNTSVLNKAIPSRKKVDSPIIFQLTLLKLRTYCVCDEKIVDLGYSSTTIGETTNGVLLCEHQVTDQTNKSKFRRSWNLTDCLFQMDSGKNDKFLVGETSYDIRTELILGLLFHTLKQTVETRLNGDVTECVVTIPFWLTSVQRQQIKASGEVAGFEKTFLINENSLMAMQFAYSRFHERQRSIVVLSENSNQIDSSVYTCDKHYSSVEMIGHCSVFNDSVQPKKDHNSEASPASSLERIMESCKIALKMNDTPLKHFVDYYMGGSTSRNVVVLYHSEEYRKILTKMGNQISTAGNVCYVDEYSITKEASVLKELTMKEPRRHDWVSENVYAQNGSGREVLLLAKQNHNHNTYLKTLRISTSLNSSDETTNVFQKDIRGQKSLIGSVKLNTLVRNSEIEVLLEISNESIVNLAIKQPFNDPSIKVTLHHEKLKDDQIFACSTLLQTFQILEEIKETTNQ